MLSFYLRAEAASTIRSFSTFVFFFSPSFAVPSSIPNVLWPSILASTILGEENQKMHDCHMEGMRIKATSKLYHQIPFVLSKTHIVQSSPNIEYITSHVYCLLDSYLCHSFWKTNQTWILELWCMSARVYWVRKRKKARAQRSQWNYWSCQRFSENRKIRSRMFWFSFTSSITLPSVPSVLPPM